MNKHFWRLDQQKNKTLSNSRTPLVSARVEVLPCDDTNAAEWILCLLDDRKVQSLERLKSGICKLT